MECYDDDGLRDVGFQLQRLLESCASDDNVLVVICRRFPDEIKQGLLVGDARFTVLLGAAYDALQERGLLRPGTEREPTIARLAKMHATAAA